MMHTFMLCYQSIVLEQKFEIYKTNIFVAIKEHRKKIEDFFNSLKKNLKKMHTFEVGQILKLPGLELIGMPIYNHHVIFSGNFSCCFFCFITSFFDNTYI